MIWIATLIIGMIFGAMILFVGIAIGRHLGEAEALRQTYLEDEFGEDQHQ